MAITLAQVVDRVREQHPSFDKRIVPNQALARFYDRYQRRLTYDVLRINADVLVVELNIPYADSLLIGNAGFALPAFIGVRPGMVRFTNDTTRFGELTLLKFQDRLSPVGIYPIYIRGTTLFLVGRPDAWIGVASLEFAYIPVPSTLTALSSTFTLPDGALDTLAAAGGLFAAQLTSARPDVPKIDVALFATQAERCEEAFLVGVGTYHQATVHYVKDAF